MPELPEVETSRRGIEPHLINKQLLMSLFGSINYAGPSPKIFPRWLKDKRFNRYVAAQNIFT